MNLLEVKRRLDSKLIQRSSATPLGFIVIAVIFILFKFGVEQNRNLVLGSAIAIIVISLFRISIHRKNSSLIKISDSEIRKIKLIIIVNAIFISIMINSILYEIGFDSQYTLAVIVIAIGMSSASMVTISANPYIHLHFILSLFIPLFVIMYLKIGAGIFDNVMFWLLNLQNVYVFYQGGDYRRYYRRSIETELNLEKMNIDLQNSRQEIIEQTAKTVHSSRLASLGEMAAGIAHEVNNPLAIIQASVEQIEKFLPPNLQSEKKVTQPTEKIKNAVNRIERIVRGLRTFSKQSDLNPMVKVSANKVIRDTLDFCAEKFRLGGIDLILNCPNDFEIECRPVQISQILVNLLNNAYDAIEITVSENQNDNLPASKEKNISISCRTDSNHVLISVSNSGTKIPERNREKIFHPFFTTKEVGKGTGLGLSISRNIALNHKGDLYLEPTAQQTTFTIMLPIVK